MFYKAPAKKKLRMTLTQESSSISNPKKRNTLNSNILLTEYKILRYRLRMHERNVTDTVLEECRDLLG